MKFVVLLGVVVLAASAAFADTQSKSYSHWRVNDDGFAVTFFVDQVTVQSVARDIGQNASTWLIEHLKDSVSVRRGATACVLVDFSPGAMSELRQALHFAVHCETPVTGSVDVTIASFVEEIPSHVHFARFEVEHRPTQEKLFSRRAVAHTLNWASGDVVHDDWQNTFGSYLRFGFEHILIGFDHIAFLAALLLLSQRVSRVVWIVTGFTLGHSVTLAMTAMGWVLPNGAWTESFIGFSIALVAIENVVVRGGLHGADNLVGAVLLGCALATYLLGSSVALSVAGLALFSYCYLRLMSSESQVQRWRPLMTAMFGLVHGFGFAGVLTEVGIPDQALLPALVGFNVGVELGQLLLVALMLVVVGLPLGRLGFAQARVAIDVASAALCSLGVYWFISRLF